MCPASGRLASASTQCAASSSPTTSSRTTTSTWRPRGDTLSARFVQNAPNARLRSERFAQNARNPGALSLKFGVVVFPGTWSDRDCGWVVDQVLGAHLQYLWHKDADLKGCDCIILPGGFAYGDYLRTGAIARFAPVMESVAEFADRGGLVWGICNGFQILCEAGLLPGALIRNSSLRFICRPVYLRAERIDTPFTSAARQAQILKMPIAHGEGNYTMD